MEKNPENGLPLRNLSLVRAIYHKRLPRLRRRYIKGKSIRDLAHSFRVSHPTILTILKYPERSVSLKVMLKIIRGTEAKRIRL